MSQWKVIFKTNKQYEAEIVKDVLESHYLQPVIVNKKDSSYHFGNFEIHISTEQAMEAMQIIRNDISFK